MFNKSCKCSKAWEFLFTDKRAAWIWLPVRLYVGWAWLEAGWAKVFNPAWTGATAGASIKGFVAGALAKTSGAHPDVTMWYAWFLKNLVLTMPEVWSYAVAYGEVLVGLGLIVGAFVATASFFGIVMNGSYLLAGTVSSNPVLLILGIGIFSARKVSGLIGLDRFIKPWMEKHCKDCSWWKKLMKR
jgi:thiosulfate dehydrogenase [quinone] large subunit